MNDKVVHEIENYLHQILSNAEYISSNSDMKEYSDKIKSVVYKIDALISDSTMEKKNIEIDIQDNVDFSKYIGLNILVVDDLSDNIKIMENIFNTLSCNIKAVISGEEALSLYRDGYKPDIVCMDIVMPGIDGYTTTKKLKKMGCNAYFIAISALKNQTKDVVSLFDIWLPKPFTIEHIMNALSMYRSCKILNKNIDKEEYKISYISDDLKDKIFKLAQNGAYTELLKVITILPDSKDKEFLMQHLKKIDFATIIGCI